MARRLTLAAHCLLDPLSRPPGLAAPPRPDIDGPVYQLPCPELSYLGPGRWEVSREQLDFPGYRRHCHELALRVAEDVANLVAGGTLVVRLLGVPKSPSCAAETTTVGYAGGRVRIAGDSSSGASEDTRQGHLEHRHVSGEGVFVEELARQLSAAGVGFQAADAISGECAGPGKA